MRAFYIFMGNVGANSLAFSGLLRILLCGYIVLDKIFALGGVAHFCFQIGRVGIKVVCTVIEAALPKFSLNA